MKQRFLFMLILVILLGSTSFAEEPIQSLLLEDIRIHSDDGVLTLEDGTFLLGGNDGTIQKPGDARAISVSPFGEINWEISDGFDKQSNNNYYTLCAMPSGIVFAEHVAWGEEDSKYLVTIKDGEIISRTTLPYPLGYYIYQINDGIMVQFTHRSESIPNQGNRYFQGLTQYNEKLEVVWTKEYDTSFYCKEILPTDDGFYLIGACQVVTDNLLSSRAYIAKIDRAGEMQWEKMLPDLFSDCTDAVLMENGNLVVLGHGPYEYSSFDSVIVMLNQEGEQLFMKTYSRSELYYNSIVQMDQMFLCAGLFKEAGEYTITVGLVNQLGDLVREWTENTVLDRPMMVDLQVTPYGPYLISNGKSSGSQPNPTVIQKITIPPPNG